MLEWLNSSIGTDWATYASLFLAFVGVLTAVRYISKKKSLSQTQKHTSGTSIQIGGNVNIGAGEDDAVR